jgi:hypothetical protein
MLNLARAQEIRLERARQRRALVGAPVEQVVEAIVAPTPELAGIRLSTLLIPDNGHERGAIPKIGKTRLKRVFAELGRDFPQGRRWHEALRLCDVERYERERLVAALLKQAPANWRNGALA